ncbi:hypothetical protein DFH29DRAFT_1078966 [Suillus ampliporus]|nr:hypothetical protein DFH29DRAFT_1078966 [Suillus ampliporus]
MPRQGTSPRAWCVLHSCRFMSTSDTASQTVRHGTTASSCTVIFGRSPRYCSATTARQDGSIDHRHHAIAQEVEYKTLSDYQYKHFHNTPETKSLTNTTCLKNSFAIIGAGPTAGIPIVKAFLSIGAPILVIARPTSTNTSALPTDDPNLKVVRADYTSASEISAILREHKVDVLISTNGLFHEFVPWLTALADTGKFHIVNKGETPGSFTAVSDVAGYVAHILTTQPPSRLLDVEIHIEGQRATFSEIAALYKGSVPVVHCDALPTEGVPNAPFRTFFQKHVGVGGGSCGWNPVTESDDPVSASRDNSLWEGHRWLTVGEVLGL